MREIKFRAWDKLKNKMILVFMLHFSETPKYSSDMLCMDRKLSHINNGSVNDIDGRYILMQFTGLHDKNGKEIYEGDIVKLGEDIKEIVWGGHWNYSGFGLHGKRNKKQDWETEFTWDILSPELAKILEVINNIYES